MKDVSLEDRLWAVLREDFVPDMILHEFACSCYERGLKTLGVEDQRCWNAVDTKRKWLLGDIPYNELTIARSSVRAAIPGEACWVADQSAYWAASFISAWSACLTINMESELKWQIEELKKMLLEENESEENENY